MSRPKVAILAIIVLAMTLVAWTGAAQAQVTERVSVANDGTEGDGYSYGRVACSADGRYVAFCSFASNLVSGDTNSYSDIFVRDLTLGITTRVSVASDGTQGNSYSWTPSISADGRYVAFESLASNLVPGDTNEQEDVFIHDVATGTTQRVSVAGDGTPANNSSDSPVISADGRYVAFASHASNLVSGDDSFKKDIFVRDRVAGSVERISVNSAGVAGDGDSAYPSISADGRFVAFQSYSGNLASSDVNLTGSEDIFVRDRVAGTTEHASVDGTGAGGDSGGYNPSISADGRYVAFESDARNLVPGDTNNFRDVFVHDRQTGATTRVSMARSGDQADWPSYYPSISADGRYVAFASDARNLIPEGTSGRQVYLRDLVTGHFQLLSVSPAGVTGNGLSSSPAVSADGGRVVFQSEAWNLVPSDTNWLQDVFSAQVDWMPAVTGLSPAIGSAYGANSVVITGTNFFGVTAVSFGGVPATSFVVDSVRQIVAVAPAHATGSVQVEVSAAYGTSSNGADDYQYILPPTITSINPPSGSFVGGTSVEISGTDFVAVSAVTFGGASATYYNVESPTRITAIAPPRAAGTVQVQVTAGGGATENTAADDYTYSLVAPTATGLNPTAGSVRGGNSVIIAGTDFAGLSGPGAVTFGGANARSYTVDSPTQITAVAPPHEPGIVQVQISTPGGSSADVPADDYTYVADLISPIQDHERVSLDSDEIQGNNHSDFPSASSDGRYVAFASVAANLVPGDTNATADIFVRDRETGSHAAGERGHRRHPGQRRERLTLHERRRQIRGVPVRRQQPGARRHERRYRRLPL